MYQQHDKDTTYDVHIADNFDPAQFEQPNPQLCQTIDWQDPLFIETPLRPVKAMEPEMIPEHLRGWLTDIAHRMKCPLDFVASPMVVMLSALIGTRLAIKPKSRDPWTIVPNLWGAVIGDPSTMKSPSVSEVFKPLNRLIVAAKSKFDEQIKEYEHAVTDHETQKKVYQTQEQERLRGKPVNGDPVPYPQAPAKPTQRRYMTNDATIEKIGELLNENPSGLLQFRDELIGLLAGWDKAGREQDRAFYLEAWNGNGSMTIDRIGRGTTFVKNVCLSLFGGIQPTKLTGYLEAATGYDNDGFVQRLQLAVYPDKSKWAYVDEYADKSARDKAFALIQQVDETDFSTISYQVDEYNELPFTRFDEAAQEVFRDWLTYWEEVVLPNESGLLLEHFTKYRSLMPSLALIFHVVNTVDSPAPQDSSQKILVSQSAAQMAVKWCEYLQSHARRIYGLLESMATTGAKELIKHLKAGDLPDGFKVRDIQRKNWSFLTSTEQIDASLAVLLSTYWIREEQPAPTTNGRPPALTYRINPKILPNP